MQEQLRGGFGQVSRKPGRNSRAAKDKITDLDIWDREMTGSGDPVLEARDRHAKDRYARERGATNQTPQRPIGQKAALETDWPGTQEGNMLGSNRPETRRPNKKVVIEKGIQCRTWSRHPDR